MGESTYIAEAYSNFLIVFTTPILLCFGFVISGWFDISCDAFLPLVWFSNNFIWMKVLTDATFFIGKANLVEHISNWKGKIYPQAWLWIEGTCRGILILRDGKSVKNSKDKISDQKNSTINAYFATYCNSRQNTVNSPKMNKVTLNCSFIYQILQHSTNSTVLIALA